MSQTESQDGVIAFLSSPVAFGAGKDPVKIVETHISVVFLCQDRVLKLKRAVTFPYLDFSTPEKRKIACEAEVRINSRTAPTIYKGVVAVTREADGTLAVGGNGAPIDWLVDMNRFDEDTLFDRLAQDGGLERPMIEDLADSIAKFHQSAEIRKDAGGAKGTGLIIENNGQCFAGSAEGILDQGDTEKLARLSKQMLDANAGLLDKRRDDGRVRHCHGDLHLRNICLIDGRPTLFDGIEFNEEFANIDVLYDLAFLIMDLEHRGLSDLANIVFNRYLDITGEGSAVAGGLRVMALFLSMRAAIRSHVDLAQAKALSDSDKARARAKESGDYLKMALDFLKPSSPKLIAVGGLSGSGKSRMARVLAPHVARAPGARILRTDSIRKRLAGVPLTSRLGAEGYTPEMTERTYRAMMDEVVETLAAGGTAIADAVFAQPEERVSIAEIAANAGVPFVGLWLEAPPGVMAKRVTERQRNVSDADVGVLEKQLTYDLGPMEWQRIDSSGPKEETVKAGLAAVGA
ncbi:MAG: AAA family ATPase [Rhodospirillales bacterium]|nr:AAA family ATPase [Rhodospirillales bacterium]